MLIQQTSVDALLKCFANAKANSFENMLDPLLKIFRISTAVTSAMSKPQFFKRLIDRLNHKKAVVRLALLRLLRIACDVHPNRGALVERFGIFDIVEKLSADDGAVLVRELAREIKPSLKPVLKPAVIKTGANETPRVHVVSRPKSRRTASETSLIITDSPRTGGNYSASTLASNRRVKSRHTMLNEPTLDS